MVQQRLTTSHWFSVHLTLLSQVLRVKMVQILCFLQLLRNWRRNTWILFARILIRKSWEQATPTSHLWIQIVWDWCESWRVRRDLQIPQSSFHPRGGCWIFLMSLAPASAKSSALPTPTSPLRIKSVWDWCESWRTKLKLIRTRRSRLRCQRQFAQGMSRFQQPDDRHNSRQLVLIILQFVVVWRSHWSGDNRDINIRIIAISPYPCCVWSDVTTIPPVSTVSCCFNGCAWAGREGQKRRNDYPHSTRPLHQPL